MINKAMTDRIAELEDKLVKLKPTPKKRGRPRKKVTK
jgi:hypothetical protein